MLAQVPWPAEFAAPLVVVVSPPAPLAGRVVDENGAPLAGARIELAPPNNLRTGSDVILDLSVADETACAIVLYQGDEEVTRLPLELAPGEIRIVEP